MDYSTNEVARTTRNKIRLAIMGFGLFAEKSLLPATMTCKKVELVAITKRHEIDARAMASEFEIPSAYATNSKQFLDDKSIDAVFVATPNSEHRHDVEAVLAAGKHVIVEKPMAMNASECTGMIDTAIQHERKLMVAQCLRFNTVVRHVKELIDAGKLGRLVTLTCDFMSQGKESKRQWKYDMALAGGGAAFDLGVHLVDTVRFLANSPVKNAWVAVEPDARPPGQVDTLAAFVISFNNGVVARATSSYDGPRHTYIEAYGTKGFVRAVDFQPVNAKVSVEMELDGVQERRTIQNGDHYTAEMDAFATAILDGTRVPIPGQEGLANQRIIDLVNKHG